jgi:hypothetical protein
MLFVWMTPIDSLLQDTFRFIVWMTPIDSFFTLTCLAGLSIFLKSTSTSLFTGSTFYYNLNNFHEYLTQHSLKSGGTKDHIRQVTGGGRERSKHALLATLVQQSSLPYLF